jgi:hypothetical protein
VTDQRNNIVAGHQAGRDVTVVHNSPETFMTSLREKFDLERANKSQFRDVIDKLGYYQDSIDQRPVGLEKKLDLGNRQSEIREALRAKELFVKLMTLHSLSEASQILIAYCLGLVHQYFKARVVPLINQGASHDQVDTVVVEQVVRPVLGELGTNFLNLTPQEISGQWQSTIQRLTPITVRFVCYTFSRTSLGDNMTRESSAY